MKRQRLLANRFSLNYLFVRQTTRATPMSGQAGSRRDMCACLKRLEQDSFECIFFCPRRERLFLLFARFL